MTWDRRTVWLTATPIGLCMVAAVVASARPSPGPVASWVVVGLILPALVLMLVRLGQVQGQWEDVNEALDLQDKWRRQREACR